MKNILISGGAGFIGSNLALQLHSCGYQVTVLDNFSKQIHGENFESESYLYKNILGKAAIINGDVTQKEDWRKALQGVDAIFHLAAETGTGQSMYEISRFVKTNVLGTSQLLEVLMTEKHQVQKIILASTRAVYGEGKYVDAGGNLRYPRQRNAADMAAGNFEIIGEDGKLLNAVATDENSAVHPTSIYGITKQNQEQMLQAVCPSLGICTAVLRFQNVYGEGQSLKNPYTGILSIFSTQILKRQNVQIFEDGKESRDFIHVDDAVDALKCCLENDCSNGKIYNAGSGKPRTVLNIAETLIKNYDAKVSAVVTGKYRVGDIRHNFADVSKIKDELQFEAKIDFESGLKRFTDWVKTQELGDNFYEKSLQEMKNKGFLK